MALEHWLAFVAASMILLIIPGPTVLTVISYSVTHGRKANLPLVLAVALGGSTALLLSLLGLGALLAASSAWFFAVKWIGGLYLLYLGIRLLRSGITVKAQADTTPGSTLQAGPRDDAGPMQTVLTQAVDNTVVQDSAGKLFVNTWLVTALNPKGIVFFVAFLPQFIDRGTDPIPQLWILSITFVVLASLNATAYTVFANAARCMLALPRAQQRFNLAGGSLLSMAGIWALTARQAA